MKFKIGNKVRILSRATNVGVEREEVGKVGVITSIDWSSGKYYGIHVKMNEVCKERGYLPTWNVGYTMIELIPRKNEQLVFNFMLKG